MTSNFHEFMGMVGVVSSATFFILMFRWGIYRLGSMEQALQRSEAARTDNV